MTKRKDWIIEGSNGKPILTEGHFQKELKAPVIIFAHGYKGFKDWGAWNNMVPYFLEAGFHFVKFNFSHNGGTVNNPIDFPDLESFSENTYSKELYDLNCVVDDIEGRDLVSDIFLIGHSRGGGDAILQASRDKRIKKLITWAAISDIYSRFPQGEKLKQWLKDGIRYETNRRTKQEMPVKKLIYEDALKNRDKLDIRSAASSISCPWLIIHGKNDQAVNAEGAYELNRENRNSQLLIIPHTAHTFGTKHPFEEDMLPKPFLEVVEKSVAFLLS